MADFVKKPSPSASGSSKAEDDGGERERSSIEFPYMDLDDAMAVAKAIHEHSGSSVCQYDQLAAQMKLSMSSSGFRSRLTTARMFGLTESDRSGGGVRLTELGQMIVDGQRQREARVAAFLRVPLYKAMYDLYRGKVLPQATSAVEREMQALGVAQKQTGRARQAFERSAQSAGFFEKGRDRLVAPGSAGDPPNGDKTKKTGTGTGTGSGDGTDGTDHLHLMVRGLLQKLPPPDAEWPVAEQVKWLQTAAHMFGLLYKSDGKIKIEIAAGEGE